MIRTPDYLPSLPAVRRYAVDTLLDLSRILRVRDGFEGDVVRLEVDSAEGDAPAGFAEAAVTGWGVRGEDGVVSIPARSLDMLAAAAAASAEQESTVRDRLGRVPSRENALARAGVERTPLVSLAALELRRAAAAAAGDRQFRALAPWPNGKRWGLAFTYDVDVVDAWWPAAAGARAVELARRGQFADGARVAMATAGSMVRLPAVDQIRSFVQTDLRAGVSSTWFLLCGTPTLRTVAAGDLSYRPEGRRIRSLIREIVDAGNEIGLHGSMETAERPEAFAEQRIRLEQLTTREVLGVRQHFLRMDPGASQRHMHTAGFEYDATFGFPDRTGFRLGAADVVEGWDIRSGERTGVDEVPLHWMDRTFTKYLGQEDPQCWLSDAEELAREVRGVEGLFVSLFHPMLTAALGYPRAENLHESCVAKLMDETAYVDRLDRIVHWRRVRRSSRAELVTEEGRVRARASGAGDWPLLLEDESGRPRETIGD